MSIRSVLNEAVNDVEFARVVKKIAGMTDRNDHNGARLEGAKLVGKYSSVKTNKYVDIYQAIIDIADAEGSMPMALLKYRDSVDDQFFKFVDQVFKNDEAKAVALHGAY